MTIGRIPKKRQPKSLPAKRAKRTPEEQRAEIERVAREHGVDLSEKAFNKVLRKVGPVPSTDRDRNGSEKRQVVLLQA